MSKVIIMYNEGKNHTITTKAKIEGDKFSKYLNDGYKPIAFASNIGNVAIQVSPYLEKDHKTLFG